MGRPPSPPRTYDDNHMDLPDYEGSARPPNFVQYAINGPGVIPSTATVKALNPGVYSIIWHNDVPTLVNVGIKSDDLIRLPDSKSDEVIAEIEHFWQLGPRYKQFGFNHKRGFLLHGPPGSGKTSTVITVVQKMINDGGLVLLAGGKTHPDTATQMLARIREIEPMRPIVVVMEDLDAYIHEFGEKEILSLLDGETSLSSVVFLATTNYPEDLDGRVTNRPSRFDKVVEIGAPNAEARKVYFTSRNLGLSENDLNEWVSLTKGFSIAHCKELVIGVMCLEEPFDHVLTRLKGMKKVPKSTGVERKAGFGTNND